MTGRAMALARHSRSKWPIGMRPFASCCDRQTTSPAAHATFSKNPAHGRARATPQSAEGAPRPPKPRSQASPHLRERSKLSHAEFAQVDALHEDLGNLVPVRAGHQRLGGRFILGPSAAAKAASMVEREKPVKTILLARLAGSASSQRGRSKRARGPWHARCAGRGRERDGSLKQGSRPIGANVRRGRWPRGSRRGSRAPVQRTTPPLTL